MKKVLTEAIHVIIGILVCFAVGYGLLIMVYCIPESKMIPKVEESVGYFTEGDTRPNPTGVETSIGDSFSDALILMTAVHRKEYPAYKEALLGIRSGDMDTSVYENFFTVYKYHKSVEGETVYGRIWHGELTYIKPLLLCFHYGQIRYILGVILLALYSFLIYRLSRLEPKMILSVVVVTVFADPLAIIGSMMYAGLAIVALAAMICVTYMKEKDRAPSYCRYMFMLFGICAVYIDYFTFPLITWGLPLVLYCALYEKSEKKALLPRAVSMSAMWAIGYAGMWMSKWILGSVISRTNLFTEAMGSAKTRSSHDIKLGASKVGFFEVISDNLGVIGSVVGGIVIFALIVACIIGVIRKRQVRLWYLFITAIPFVWSFVSMEHAYLHSFFTYRNFLPVIFAMIVSAMEGLSGIDIKAWLKENVATTTRHK